ncbi:fibronectin type III domain-containing protein 7-like [Diretmus argenteus]
MTVSVFSTTSKTIFLRWTRYPGASSYKITIAPKNSPNNPSAFAQFGPNTVMGSVNSLSPNTLYVCNVEALDSSQLTLSNATVDSTTALEVMDPIETVKPKDSRTMIVVFSQKPSATHYIIRIENAAGYFAEETVTSSPAEIQSLTPYTDYSLSIMAENSGGRNQPSLPVEAKTVLPPPQLATSSPSNDSIIVSWAPVDYAVNYTLAIHKLHSNTTLTLTTEDTNLTISDLDAGSLYIITCYAWDQEGRKGEGSLYINQTTRPPTPASVNVSIVTNNGTAGFSVSWFLDQEVYRTIQYLVTSDRNLECTSTSSPCTLSPVACGETYTIQVTASNEAGPSYPSYPVVVSPFPCPPESLAVVETEAGNCTLSWNTVPHADYYIAFVKRDNGSEEICNTNGSSCSYHCQCGYTYLMSVFAYNQAGSSPPGEMLNYTTLPCCPEDVSILLVATDTLEITWTAARGAEVYETRAMDNSDIIVCNDTAPVCALSDLTCDRPYTVLVTPCNEIRGCNRACSSHTKDTAPCMPEDLKEIERNANGITVMWTAHNRAANYTVSVLGEDRTHTCTTTTNSCDITDLPCGYTYEVTAIATSTAGQSLPSYSITLETAPCCPVNLTVDQVTQAMTNVTWSHARGAESFITSLTSLRGHARCHTQDSHCLMGCITCGTNYTVSMEAISRSGHKSNCTYQGFSSRTCCPSGVKLYRMASNSLRVYWRSSAGNLNYTAEIMGSSSSSSANYTCTGENSCDVSNIQCGNVYRVVVAPLTSQGYTVQFCSQRLYSVMYRGRRSLD